MSKPEHFLLVRLHDEPVGVIEVRGEGSRFSFVESYLGSSDRRVLGLSFEEALRSGWTGFRHLPVWFVNLLPEGRLRTVIDAGLRLSDHDGSLISNELSLISALGADLPGAVTVAPHIGAPDLSGDWLSTLDEETSARTTSGLSPAFRFSLAGIGLKFSVTRVKSQFIGSASDQLGDWLIKFPDRTFPNLPLNEFAMMSLARRVGIDVPEIEYVHRDDVRDLPDEQWSGENHAFAIRRFDRTPHGRVHIEDLAQVRSYSPDDKYRGTCETAANLFYRGRDEASLLEFVRRLAFSLAVGNWDAHLKNWSLIYHDPRVPVISPAYDLVSVAGYPGLGISSEIALEFAGTRASNALDIGAFARLARKLRVSEDSVVQTARGVFRGVQDEWAPTAELLSSDRRMKDAIEDHVAGATAQFLQ
ncbi:MAG: type toxin-antitoxin system HipA family toxin [Rhodoglobus sp.]|nr:type toxin-antitoxin system HipA family toxin [Rhodoglobus sp.]